ncbi:tetratricopeptide repeat protein [Actinokineospora sp. HUAS TT18]|uniref:tetratricopeptide repeat protein n=1 Tax=Actinokineospora sp. HUAS TT18 TaxID=3447451 RepID=UPI003F523FEC
MVDAVDDRHGRHLRMVEQLLEGADWDTATRVIGCARESCVRDGHGADCACEIEVLAARVQFGKGEYKAAKDRLTALMASARVRAAASADDITVALIANELGVVCKTAGWLDDAHRYYTVASAVFRRNGQTDEWASVLHNLAALRSLQGRPLDGVELAREGIRVRIGLHGPASVLVASDRSNLAGLLHRAGLVDEAAAELAMALDLFESAYGRLHLDVAVCLSGLASLAADQGEYEDAEMLYRESIEIKSVNNGARHPETLVTRYNLGKLLAESGRPAEAADELRDVVSGLEGVVSDDHIVLVRARRLLSD